MGMSGVGATDGVEVQVPRVAIDINYSIELILYLDRQMLNLIWVNRVRPTYDRSPRFNLALDTTSSNVQLQRDFCMPSCFRRFKLTKGQFLNRSTLLDAQYQDLMQRMLWAVSCCVSSKQKNTSYLVERIA